MSNFKVENDRPRRNSDESKGGEAQGNEREGQSQTAPTHHQRVSGNHHHQGQSEDSDGSSDRSSGTHGAHHTGYYGTGATDDTAAAGSSSHYGEGYGENDSQDGRGQKTGGSPNTGWNKNGDIDNGDDSDAAGGDTSRGGEFSVPNFPTSVKVKTGLQDSQVQQLGKELADKFGNNDPEATSIINGLASGSPDAIAHAVSFLKTKDAASTDSKTGDDTSSESGSDGAGKSSGSSSRGASGGLSQHELRIANQKKAAAAQAESLTSDGTEDMASKQKQAKGDKSAKGKGGKGGSKGAAGGAAEGGGGAAEGGGGGGGGGDTGGGIGGLSGMELVQAVMLLAAQEASKSAQDLAKQVQANTAIKDKYRAELAPMRLQMASMQNSDSTDGSTGVSSSQATLNAQMSNIQDKMDAVGDDNQILFIKLQNATQQYSSMLQACSNVSKTLFDIDKAVIGNIGH